jgi:predicted ester cyclase
MTSEQNKAIVRRFYKAFEEQDIRALEDVLASDLSAYNPNLQNRDQHLQGIKTWNASFSDNHFEVLEQVAAEDTVVSRVTLHSRHTKAPFMGILATGEAYELPAVSIEKIKNGKIVERRVFSERLRMLSQQLQEQNKALIRRFIEESGKNDQTVYRELMAPDFVAHLALGPQDRETFLQHSSAFTQAFSDIRITLLEQTAEGELVTTRVTWRGVHSGDFRGMPSTGKQIAILAFMTERIRDGKVVEHWSLFDQMSMMQQLGVIPPP